MTDAEEQLRDLLGDLDVPMFILTVAHEGERSGCLLGFGTQASIDPVRFLACVSEVNHTFAPAMASTHVAVHLAPDEPDLALARLFGEETGDEIDKFERCRWHEGPQGQPILEDCPAWFVGRVRDRHRLGDHHGLLLEPVAVDGRAEGYLHLSRATQLDPGHPV
jgi:flavin reductase (DIM6/NTAB) family NADH-FMN oxidoreductase RutF